MSDVREILERGVAGVGPPHDPLDRMLRRRARRRRNGRIGVAVLALLIAAVATGSLVRVFEAQQGKVPAGPTSAGRISAENVHRLELKWTADIGGPGDGGDYGGVRDILSAHDGLVLALDRQGKVHAFDEACGAGGATCEPAWTTGEGNNTFVVEEGVFVGPASGGGGLVAFPVDGCNEPAEVCPASNRTSKWPEFQHAGGGVVFVLDDSNLPYLAYGVNCEEATICGPLWKTPGGYWRILSVGEGLAYGTRPLDESRPHGKMVLGAFPLDCRTDGEVCDPAWVAPVADRIEATSSAHGRLYVLTERSFEVHDPRCREDGGECQALSVFRMPRTPDFHPDIDMLDPTIQTDGQYVYVYAANRSTPVLYAFPADCGSGQGECEPSWTHDQFFLVGPDEIAVVEGVVILRPPEDLEGYLEGFSCEPGARCSQSWGFPLGPIGAGGMVPGDGLVFVGGDAGTVTAFRADCQVECEPAWVGPFSGGAIAAPPVVTDTGVYVLAADGTISAFGLPD